WRCLVLDIRQRVLEERRLNLVDFSRRLAIVDGLNAALRSHEFYSERCFREVFERPGLPDVLYQLLSAGSATGRSVRQIRWLNRLLFEWAFRDCVNGSSWHGWRLS